MATAAPPLMTIEEFLALPDDGIERDLINGRIIEYGEGVTRRNVRHSRTETNIAATLRHWLDQQPRPHGFIVSGEAGVRLGGVRLGGEDSTTVGIDVAYISAEVARKTPEDATLIEGPPILAVEILSPFDRQDHIIDKIRSYLDAGVHLVWVVEPVFRTITVYRPDAEPVLFSASQELSGEPHMPGFGIAVRALFES